MTPNEQLIELVTQESIALKVKATREELFILDIYQLDPHDPMRCIYGQMTGDCYSPRATELIVSCCARVFKAEKGALQDFDIDNLNGAPEPDKRGDYYSAIETFIDCPRNKRNGNNAALVAFLRGETDTLTLSTDF